MKRLAALIIFSLGLLGLAACDPQPVGRGTGDEAVAAPTTQAWPLATPTATPTPDPVQMYANINASQATAQAAQATAAWYASQATATEQAAIAIQTATARAEQAVYTQQAMLYAETATARAWNATATADSIHATETAIVTGTAQALVFAATQNAINITATANAASVSAYATAMFGQAESVRLAAERERQTNQVKALAPWIALAIVLAALVYIAIRRSRIMLVARDERGDAKLLVIGGNLVYDPDRNPAPVVDLRGRPSLPIPADPATVARDQMIDLATRGLPGARAAARRLPKEAAIPQPPQPPAPRPAVSVIPPASVQQITMDVLPAMLLDAVDGQVMTGDSHD